MDGILKGNFQVKNPVTATKAADDKQPNHMSIATELRKHALACLGGSMVYVERERLTWDGD